MKRSVKQLVEDEKQALFCKVNGDCLEELGNLISVTSEKVLRFYIRGPLSKE